MVENVLFGNSLGHPASSKEKTKEEGGHVVLVLLLCTGQRGGGSRTNRPWRDIWYVSFVNFSEEKY
jgi:hypothetical protein